MILLDTCALLWLVMDPKQLSARAKSLISTHSGRTVVSAISAFEIAIKSKKGKLDLKLPAEEWWETALLHHGLRSIPVTDQIALASAALPLHHSDPADRMIIATAHAHRLSVITCDPAFRAYSSTILEW